MADFWIGGNCRKISTFKFQKEKTLTSYGLMRPFWCMQSTLSVRLNLHLSFESKFIEIGCVFAEICRFKVDFLNFRKLPKCVKAKKRLFSHFISNLNSSKTRWDRSYETSVAFYPMQVACLWYRSYMLNLGGLNRTKPLKNGSFHFFALKTS